MVKWVKILKTEKTIEIQLVRLTVLCGNVLSEKMPIGPLRLDYGG